MSGFLLTSYVSYHSNREAFEKDAERTSALAAEGASREIGTQLARPVDVSVTMAGDTLLGSLLDEERERTDDPSYTEAVRSYLDSYRTLFGFDSVFLVSTATNRYYHFNGIDRTLEPGDPENTWYYDYLERDEDHSLNIDNDEAANDEITVFVNARITGEDGSTRGIVGVGFRLEDLQGLVAGFEERTQTRVRLLDGEGVVRVSTDEGEVGRDLFDSESLEPLAERVLGARDDVESLWYAADGNEGLLVSQYLPYLDWLLVVDHDTSALDAQMTRQFTAAMLIIAAVVALVLAATTGIFRRCNKIIAVETAMAERKRKTIFQEAAEQLYDSIYEVDVTHNHAASEETEHYFESLGAPKDAPYDEALGIIAQRQITADYRQGYLDTFGPEAVLDAYRKGKENLSYEFKMTDDGFAYHWIRIYANLFFWDEDQSVRMLVYRQNIDDEKRRERYLFEQMQRDALSGLYNKAATQHHISELLEAAPDTTFAFFILDIDEFKAVNDRYGHSTGDAALTEFASAVRAQFRPYDIVGRIGGDEFVAFTPMPSAAAAEKKASALVKALDMIVPTDKGDCMLTASVGVALAPDAGRDFEALYRRADAALYRAKAAGRNRFAVDGA